MDADDSQPTKHTRSALERHHDLFQTGRGREVLTGKLVIMATNAQEHQSMSGRMKERERKLVEACRGCQPRELFDMPSRSVSRCAV